MMRAMLFGLPLVLAAAASAEPVERTIASGAMSGVMRPRQEVLKTADAWQKVWNEHTARVQPKPPLPAVDFHKEMVVAIFMGQRPTGGYSVEVTEV